MNWSVKDVIVLSDIVRCARERNRQLLFSLGSKINADVETTIMRKKKIERNVMIVALCEEKIEELMKQ